MLGNLLGLNKYLLAGAAIVLVSLGGFAGVTKWQLDNARHTVQLQEIQIRDKDAQIESFEFMTKIRDQAIDLLTNRLREQEAEADQLNSELQDVQNAPPDQDGPVAPVLRGVFSR